MKRKVSALLVLNEMGTRNEDVQAFPLSTNLKRAQTGKDGWGEITIAVSNHVITNINKYVGALYMANLEQYSRCEQELKRGE